MANTSNWKETERRAAELFPGGKRRTRVGGGTYALTADDVVWGEEFEDNARRPPRIIKTQMAGDRWAAIYIDAKKKGRSALVTEFDEVEKKYAKGEDIRLVLVTHKKGQHRVLVTVTDEFFKALIRSWCQVHDLFVLEMREEEQNSDTGRTLDVEG